MKFLIFIITISALAMGITIGCKAKKEAAVATVNTAETKEHTYRLIISFISKGTGVDRNKVESFLTYVESHAKKPLYEKIQWGREGEMDFCLQLNELNKDEQILFIEKLIEQMKGSDRVFITENQACTHIKR